MTTKKIGIYGGAFDPIALHHIKIIDIVSKIMDKIIIIPAYKSLSGKKLSEGYHRINMCKLSITNNLDKIIISDYEIKNKLSGDPNNILLEHINHYNSLNPNDNNTYYFIIGFDNTSWVEKFMTYNIIRCCVVPRDGYSADKKAWYMKEPHIFLNIEKVKGSSTEAKKNKSELLHSEVNKYIRINNLYNN